MVTIAIGIVLNDLVIFSCRAESRHHYSDSSSSKHAFHHSHSHDDSRGHYIGEKGRILHNHCVMWDLLTTP